MGEPPRGCGITDHGRHGARDGANGGGPPGPLLQRRIEKEVRSQSQGAEQAGKKVDSQPQLEESQHREDDTEYQSARGRHTAGGQGTPGGPAHMAVGLAFKPLIEGGGAGGDQPGSHYGMEKREQVDIAGEFAPSRGARQPKEITDRGAHEDQPRDPRLGQFDVVSERSTAWNV